MKIYFMIKVKIDGNNEYLFFTKKPNENNMKYMPLYLESDIEFQDFTDKISNDEIKRIQNDFEKKYGFRIKGLKVKDTIRGINGKDIVVIECSKKEDPERSPEEDIEKAPEEDPEKSPEEDIEEAPEEHQISYVFLRKKDIKERTIKPEVVTEIFNENSTIVDYSIEKIYTLFFTLDGNLVFPYTFTSNKSDSKTVDSAPIVKKDGIDLNKELGYDTRMKFTLNYILNNIKDEKYSICKEAERNVYRLLPKSYLPTIISKGKIIKWKCAEIYERNENRKKYSYEYRIIILPCNSNDLKNSQNAIVISFEDFCGFAERGATQDTDDQIKGLRFTEDFDELVKDLNFRCIQQWVKIILQYQTEIQSTVKEKASGR